jgi:plastocyanin
MLGRVVRFEGLVRLSAVVVVTSIPAFLLLAPSLVVAANPAVTITESGGRYHFTPGTISISVGDSVTWTDSTDAPHTVSSDQAGGPMQSNIINQGDSYRATFNTAGTFAYHCEIHSYMHGTVHVAAAGAHRTNPPRGATPLPPTDASASGPSPLGRRGALLAIVGIGTFMTVLMFGTRFRRRAR